MSSVQQSTGWLAIRHTSVGLHPCHTCLFRNVGRSTLTVHRRTPGSVDSEISPHLLAPKGDCCQGNPSAVRGSDPENPTNASRTWGVNYPARESALAEDD